MHDVYTYVYQEESELKRQNDKLVVKLYGLLMQK